MRFYFLSHLHFSLLPKGVADFSGAMTTGDRLSGRVLRLMLVRHGEAIHNVADKNRPIGQTRTEALKNPDHHDAPLTELGIRQAKRASECLANALGGSTNYVLCSSPLRRALATARNVAPECDSITILECIRELGGHYSCDSRRTATEAVDYALSDLNFAKVVETQFYSHDDTMGADKPREGRESLERRIWDFLLWVGKTALQNPSLECVVSVTHCGFIRYLLALFHLFAPADRKVENAEIRVLLLDLNLLLSILAAMCDYPVQLTPNYKLADFLDPRIDRMSLKQALTSDWATVSRKSLVEVLESPAILEESSNFFTANIEALTNNFAVKEPLTVILYNPSPSPRLRELYCRLLDARCIDDYDEVIPTVFLRAKRICANNGSRGLPLRRQDSVTDGSPVAKRVVTSLDVKLDLSAKELVHGEMVLVLVEKNSVRREELQTLRQELLGAHAKTVWVLQCS